MSKKNNNQSSYTEKIFNLNDTSKNLLNQLNQPGICKSEH